MFCHIISKGTKPWIWLLKPLLSFETWYEPTEISSTDDQAAHCAQMAVEFQCNKKLQTKILHLPIQTQEVDAAYFFIICRHLYIKIDSSNLNI